MNREDVAVPPSKCPHCDKWLDSASAPLDSTARPAPGDVTVCIDCAGINRYGAGLRLEVATFGDVAALPLQLQRLLGRMQHAIVEARTEALYSRKRGVKVDLPSGAWVYVVQ